MEQRLHSAFAPVDILTRSELVDVLGGFAGSYAHSQARGVSYLERNSYADGATQWQVDGPDSGFAWSLKTVSVVCPSGTPGTDSVAVFTGDNVNTAPVASGLLTARGASDGGVFVARFTSNVVVVTDQRPLTILATADITAVKVIVKQVPSEMVVKL